MKAILEFNLPEEEKDYIDYFRGGSYIQAIREIVEYVKRMGDSDINVFHSWDELYDKMFSICKEHGFSPWEN